MTNLFGASPIPGFSLAEEIVSADDEKELLESIASLDLAPFRFQRWTGKRLTRSFGWRYDFEDSSFRPTEPLPAWLLPVRDRVAALAGLDPAAFAHALVTRYDPGAGIGWHRDRPQFDRVAGLSLGAPATLRFRKRLASGFQRCSVALAPRSAYLLSGEVRRDWEHSIAPGEALRCSITFRSLA